MGQARLKKEKPQHRAGPHGHEYYCNNRCGRVAYVKTNNETFVERKVPMWGWCKQCRDDAFALEGLRKLQVICETSRSQDEALKTVKRGIQLSDNHVYDLSTPLKTMPAYLALPMALPGEASNSSNIQRCNVMFRHRAHDECDGRPDGLVDPVLGANA